MKCLVLDLESGDFLFESDNFLLNCCYFISQVLDFILIVKFSFEGKTQAVCPLLPQKVYIVGYFDRSLFKNDIARKMLCDKPDRLGKGFPTAADGMTELFKVSKIKQFLEQQQTLRVGIDANEYRVVRS